MVDTDRPVNQNDKHRIIIIIIINNADGNNNNHGVADGTENVIHLNIFKSLGLEVGSWNRL